MRKHRITIRIQGESIFAKSGSESDREPTQDLLETKDPARLRVVRRNSKVLGAKDLIQKESQSRFKGDSGPCQHLTETIGTVSVCGLQSVI